VNGLLERLSGAWFWLRDAETLAHFENDPYAQGYEVLRRHREPGGYLAALGPNSPVFREPWLKLNERERAYIRACWSAEIARLGLIYEPPLVGTKAIYFRCNQPPEHLYRAVESVIESAIQILKKHEPTTADVVEAGPVSFTAAREAAMNKQIEEIAKEYSEGREIRNKPNSPKKPSNPSMVFGSDGTLLIPKIERRPRSDARRPRTPRQFHWEAQTPDEDPTDVVLHLPELDEKGFDGSSPKKRRMYADEILAYFRTFLTKPPRDFDEHRRRAQRRIPRLRCPKPRSITLGLMAFDFRQIEPKGDFKTLAKFISRKAVARSERKPWIGLSSGYRAIVNLHSRLNADSGESGH